MPATSAQATDDFDRWLIAWVWHNPSAKDQILVADGMRRDMGGQITEAQASAITQEALDLPQARNRQTLAKFLHVT